MLSHVPFKGLAYKEDPGNYLKWTACERVMSVLHNGQIKKYH